MMTRTGTVEEIKTEIESRFQDTVQSHNASKLKCNSMVSEKCGPGDFASCDGRVVKAFDLKSNGIFPRRFESYSQR